MALFDLFVVVVEMEKERPLRQLSTKGGSTVSAVKDSTATQGTASSLSHQRVLFLSRPESGMREITAEAAFK